MKIAMRQVWECKIGGEIKDLPLGADLPMRLAIEEAYMKLTGRRPEFTFSGWGGSLTASEEGALEGWVKA